MHLNWFKYMAAALLLVFALYFIFKSWQKSLTLCPRADVRPILFWGSS
jgi:hypothetical protein